MTADKFSFYKEYPKTCKTDDFWAQVKRTVNGSPVGEEQIDLIVDAVVQHLSLHSSDNLLDLCCGNGALSDRFFAHCATGLGVDFSEYLIGIAKQFFEQKPIRSYLFNDVVDFCVTPINRNHYTKAVCYGSFAYLEESSALAVLTHLNKNFPNISKVFIGNCPDRQLVKQFFEDKDYVSGIEDRPDSAIGIWRTEHQFQLLASRAGWRASFSKMPLHYYAAHYRYDVLLERVTDA